MMSLAGRSYQGSLRVPMKGEKKFALSFENETNGHLTMEGGPEKVDDDVTYILEDGGDVKLTPVKEPSPERKKKKPLQRIAYNSAKDTVTLYIAGPLGKHLNVTLSRV